MYIRNMMMIMIRYHSKAQWSNMIQQLQIDSQSKNNLNQVPFQMEQNNIHLINNIRIFNRMINLDMYNQSIISHLQINNSIHKPQVAHLIHFMDNNLNNHNNNIIPSQIQVNRVSLEINKILINRVTINMHNLYK